MITTGQALAVMLYLLPGLLGLFILETLVERKATDNLRRLTLVVTIALFAAAIVIKLIGLDALPALKSGTELDGALDFSTFLKTSFFWSCVMGLLLGILGACFSNASLAHKYLGKIVGTTKTGKTDPWHQAFSESNRKWCCVQFKSGDRLIGYPKYYSLNASKKGLFIGKAEWRRKRSTGLVRIKVKGPGVLLSDFDEIEAIEFLDGAKKGG